jgi:hypothetical protein
MPSSSVIEGKAGNNQTLVTRDEAQICRKPLASNKLVQVMRAT